MIFFRRFDSLGIPLERVTMSGASDGASGSDIAAEVAQLLRSPRMCQERQLSKSGTIVSYSEVGDPQV